MMGGSITARVPLVCIGPIAYRGHEAIRKDIENLKAALVGLNVEEAFMPAVAPTGVGRNEYYRSEEEYLTGVGDALREEYRAIVDAGLILQVDDPWLTEVHSQDPDLSPVERRKIAEVSVEALNHVIYRSALAFTDRIMVRITGHARRRLTRNQELGELGMAFVKLRVVRRNTLE